MRKNERKYLAFPSVNFFKSLYSSRQRVHLSNSIFSKISIEQIFLYVKKYHVLTLKRICSVEFLENMELKESSWYLHLCKCSPNETREIAEKRENTNKALYFLTRYGHGNDLQKVTNNTNMIARMSLILLENFVNINHRGGGGTKLP